MSYTLVTETTFRSDAYECPICGRKTTDYLTARDITLWHCLGDHGWFFIETVTGPTTGAGELGYWLPA